MLKENHLKEFIVNTLSELTELAPTEIRTDIDIGEYGVDSVMAVMLAEEINIHFKKEIADLEEFAGLSTIDDITQYLTTTS